MQSIDGGIGDKKTYLPGYDGTINLASLGWLLCKLGFMLYLVATALSRQDKYGLSTIEIGLRLVLAALILLKVPMLANSALVVTFFYLAFHHLGGLRLLKREEAP